MTQTLQRRFVQQDAAAVSLVEARAEGDAAKLAGYGAVYYDGTQGTEFVLWDDAYGRAVERILPGAFNGVLTRPDDVRGLFNHDANYVLGRTKNGTMALAVDSKGLRYDITLGKSSQASDVAEMIRRGDVSGSSFSFVIPPEGETWTTTKGADGKRNSIREISSVSVYDVGPVTFPAYSGTTAGLRSIGAGDQIAELRKLAEAAEVKPTDADAADRAAADIDQVNARLRILELSR